MKDKSNSTGLMHKFYFDQLRKFCIWLEFHQFLFLFLGGNLQRIKWERLTNKQIYSHLKKVFMNIYIWKLFSNLNIDFTWWKHWNYQLIKSMITNPRLLFCLINISKFDNLDFLGTVIFKIFILFRISSQPKFPSEEDRDAFSISKGKYIFKIANLSWN